MLNRLAIIRKENKIRQEELAEAVGVSRQTIYAIEKGKFVPTVVTAIKIAQFFGKRVEDIFFSGEEWCRLCLNSPAEAPLPVFGQGLSEYGDLKYGKFSFGFNGGEIAAVYNALLFLGFSPDLSLLVHEFEINRMAALSGFAGTDPRRLWEFFEGNDIPYEKFTERSVPNGDTVREGDVFIISYYYNSLVKPLRGIHTVCAAVRDGKFTVYNISDDDTEPAIFESLSDFLSLRSLICGYIFRKE